MEGVARMIKYVQFKQKIKKLLFNQRKWLKCSDCGELLAWHYWWDIEIGYIYKIPFLSKKNYLKIVFHDIKWRLPI